MADGFVPVFDGYLGCDELGASVVAVIHNLQKVSSFFIRNDVVHAAEFPLIHRLEHAELDLIAYLCVWADQWHLLYRFLQ